MWYAWCVPDNVNSISDIGDFVSIHKLYSSFFSYRALVFGGGLSGVSLNNAKVVAVSMNKKQTSLLCTGWFQEQIWARITLVELLVEFIELIYLHIFSIDCALDKNLQENHQRKQLNIKILRSLFTQSKHLYNQ